MEDRPVRILNPLTTSPGCRELSPGKQLVGRDQREGTSFLTHCPGLPGKASPQKSADNEGDSVGLAAWWGGQAPAALSVHLLQQHRESQAVPSPSPSRASFGQPLPGKQWSPPSDGQKESKGNRTASPLSPMEVSSILVSGEKFRTSHMWPRHETVRWAEGVSHPRMT